MSADPPHSFVYVISHATMTRRIWGRGNRRTLSMLVSRARHHGAVVEVVVAFWLTSVVEKPAITGHATSTTATAVNARMASPPALNRRTKQRVKRLGPSRAAIFTGRRGSGTPPRPIAHAPSGHHNRRRRGRSAVHHRRGTRPDVGSRHAPLPRSTSTVHRRARLRTHHRTNGRPRCRRPA